MKLTKFETKLLVCISEQQMRFSDILENFLKTYKEYFYSIKDKSFRNTVHVYMRRLIEKDLVKAKGTWNRLYSLTSKGENIKKSLMIKNVLKRVIKDEQKRI